MIMRSRLFRALLGIAVIGLILVVLNSWWSDYRTASESDARSAVATTSPNPASSVTPFKGLVLEDGLNLRVQPDITAKSIRGLKRGETVVIVGTTGSWVQVRDSVGTVGWVTNNPQYLKTLK